MASKACVNCKASLPADAVVCLKCGGRMFGPKKGNPLNVVGGIFVAVLAVSVFAANRSGGAKSEGQSAEPPERHSSAKDPPRVVVDNSPAPAEPLPAELPKRKKISWAQYQAIAEGAQLADVQQSLGQTGELDASQEVDGQIVKTYSFGDASQGAMVMVSKGRIISKMPGLLQAE